MRSAPWSLSTLEITISTGNEYLFDENPTQNLDIKLLHCLIDSAAADAIVPRLTALLGLLNRPRYRRPLARR